MKKTLFRIVAAFFVSALVVGGMTSCEENRYYPGADLVTDYFTVEARDWKWNADYDRYECYFDYYEIDDYVFDDQGAVSAGVYIWETVTNQSGRPVNVETLKSLPYVVSYVEGYVNFTEIIGFDVSRGGVLFYLQSSDGDYADLLRRYQFKVTVFWRK